MATTKAPVNRIARQASPPDANGHHEIYDIKSLGSSLRLTSTTKEELTHDLAKQLLAAPSFIGERPKRKLHVAALQHHMERGTFHWNLVTIITCRCAEPHNGHPKGTVFRMNGQHTCWARLEMPPGYRAPVAIMRYSAATEEDMRRLYSTIDRGAPRTKSNVIHSYIAGTNIFGDWSSHVRKYMPVGMATWQWEGSKVRQAHDAEDIAYLLLEEEQAVVLRVGNFLDQFAPQEHRHIMRGPVVGAMLATFKGSDAAADFWMPVATGLNLSAKRDPRARLNKFLMTTSVGTGAGARRLNSNSSVPQETMYRICILCWNAWRQKREMQTMRVPAERPEPL